MSIKRNPKFQMILNLGIQGRVKEALPFVKKISPKGLSAKEKDFISTFKNRFGKRVARKYRCSDPFVKGVIEIYQEYWFQVLLAEKTRMPAQKWLFKEVSAYCNHHGYQFKKSFNEDYFAKRLKQLIEGRGFYCITGIVEPIHEVEIWKTEKVKNYRVKLPDSTEKVRTVLLQDFVVKGWMDFATIGVYYPGGWAKKNGLYCNSGAYDLTSEKFTSAFLAHEAQHFSDYKRFPKLEQIDLEYRAKLAELFSAKKIHRKALKAFMSMAERNRKSPHAFANYCVVRDMSKILLDKKFPSSVDDWNHVSSTKVNSAASKLIHAHSLALKKKGARKVVKLIS